MKNISAVFLLVFLTYCLPAQQPAYFILGEDQFRGVQIYDVIQDSDLNYWFATNEGVYFYDYYSFQKIECDGTKSSSVFNFVINAEGTIYCYNLNNQIFKIKNKKCELFYELESNEQSADIRLAISSSDELVISARIILVLNHAGKIAKRHRAANHYIGPSFIAPDKSIHFHLDGSDSMLVYSGKEFSKKKLKVNQDLISANSVLKLFTIDRNSYALDLKTDLFYKYNTTTFELNFLPNDKLFDVKGLKRIYEIGKDVWLAGSLQGVTQFNGRTNQKSFFYDGYYISHVYRDKEGNILLCTFDKGVLVIPDIKVPGVIHSFRDDPALALYANKTLGLIIGTSKGKLFNYLNGKLNVFKEGANRSIEGIYGDPKNSFILFNNDGCCSYDLVSGLMKKIVGVSLKDAAVVSANRFYLGTNVGVFEVQKITNNQFHTNSLKILNSRVYSLEYDSKNKELYVSTAIGFFKLDSVGNLTKIIYNGEDIFPTNLYEHEGMIYLCTRANGVLVLQNGKIISSIATFVNGKVEPLKKLLIANNTIVATSANGFFQFTMDGKLIRTLNSAFGFKTKKVTDFKMLNDYLWVSHAEGIQQINLNYQLSDTSKPLIRFDKILINDELTTATHTNYFKNNQRKIQFVFSSPTLKNRETTKYHSKLVGYDTNWVTNTFDLNQVTYNALDAGSYTFILKAQNQNTFSNVIEYSFSIAPHFYSTWWFILVCIIVFLVIVFVIYRWQLRIQGKKAEQQSELYASKLTAIQSQMNPHFIFNALNSIQDLVLKGDIDNSYTFITKFSNLIRRTLNYSDKEFVDFEQEIKLLELYLSLEKLRFKKEIDYEVIIDIKDDIMIPPFLIQPFIENALVHGLLHKEGSKKLFIRFRMEEALICIIEDNGVGREKAKSIKLRQRSEHESFSGKVIQKRFEILSHAMNGKFGYSYEDLYENNTAIGTRVKLTIPVKHKF